MKIEIEVPEYSRETGLLLAWEGDYVIHTQVDSSSCTIRANAAGLISLARHMLTMAQSNVPAGVHFHLDDSNSLEEGSIELIIDRLGD